MVLDFFVKLKTSILWNVALVFMLLIITGCTEDSSPVASNKYTDEGKSALIIIVENNDGLLNSDSELYFQMYKFEMLSIFTEIFKVPIAKMIGMNLNQIIENFGETWQINHIKESAVQYYDTIITMRNETATLENFNNYLTSFSNSGYTIDLVFCLHGNEDIVAFYEDDLYIQQFANYIKSNKINLRMLYQTCCYAGQALSKWESSGICAVNGAVGLNNITLFSPGYFMEEWVNGTAFDDAVSNSFQRDIDKIGSYNDRIPSKQYILTQENINNSIQKVAGSNIKITKSNYLKVEAL